MTYVGIIISVGSHRNEEKSISQDLLEDCNTFRKFVWITGLHLLELACWEPMLYDSPVHSKPGTILSSFTLKACYYPLLFHPLHIKNK